jgi:hypothetical protein
MGNSQAYIVRIWRSGPDGRWFFSVQDVAIGERHGFADLDGLLAYFYTAVRDPPNPGDKPAGEGGLPGEVDG